MKCLFTRNNLVRLARRWKNDNRLPHSTEIRGDRIMTMVDKQNKFSGMVAKLIMFAQDNGYKVTFGDAFRDHRVKYGHPKSLHRSRLAVDLNLFKDGRYLQTDDDHLPLGEYWESLGGSWGGRFDDGNHYSLAHDGMK